MSTQSTIPNPLHARPALLAEDLAVADGPNARFEPGPFAFIAVPEASWSDERLSAHAELLRSLLATGADPVYVVPDAKYTTALLAERGIRVEIPLPQPEG